MRQGSINYKGHEISFHEAGNGFPLVLLHGYLESKEIWNPLIPLLSGKYRLICPDIPGHGNSDTPTEVVTMDYLAGSIRAVLQALSVESCVMAGHSMGGYVTLAYAALFPDNLRGFILLHSSPFADSDEKKINREREAEMVKQGKKDLIVNTNIPKAFAGTNLKILAAEVERAKLIALSTPSEGIIALLKGMKNRPDKTEFIIGTDIPYIWVLGLKDNYIDSRQVAEKFSPKVKDKIVFLENSGHMGFIEESEKTAGYINDFIISLQYR